MPLIHSHADVSSEARGLHLLFDPLSTSICRESEQQWLWQVCTYAQRRLTCLLSDAISPEISCTGLFVVGTHLKHLSETLLVSSTTNVSFEEIWKIMPHFAQKEKGFD